MRQQLLRATAAGAAVSAFAMPAAAQDSNLLNLQTTVPAFCQAALWSGSPALNVGDLTGPTGFLVPSFGGTTTIQTSTNYYCNAPAKVTLTATPLQVTPAVTVTDDAFTSRIDYTATFTWNAVTGATTSNAASPTILTTSQPNTGQLKVQISNPTVDGTRRPVAGAYAGAVTVTVAVS